MTNLIATGRQCQPRTPHAALQLSSCYAAGSTTRQPPKITCTAASDCCQQTAINTRAHVPPRRLAPSSKRRKLSDRPARTLRVEDHKSQSITQAVIIISSSSNPSRAWHTAAAAAADVSSSAMLRTPPCTSSIARPPSTAAGWPCSQRRSGRLLAAPPPR